MLQDSRSTKRKRLKENWKTWRADFEDITPIQGVEISSWKWMPCPLQNARKQDILHLCAWVNLHVTETAETDDHEQEEIPSKYQFPFHLALSPTTKRLV